MTLSDFFDYGAMLNPGGICLSQEDFQLTYPEVNFHTHQIAWALKRQGVARQSSVATLSPNNIWAYVALLGLQRAGCAWVPLNARSSQQDLIDHLNRTKSCWLFYHSKFESFIEAIKSQVPTLLGCVRINSDSLSAPSSALTKLYLDEFVEFPKPEHDPSAEIYKIAMSGGTTGRPKAVLQSNIALQTNIATSLSLRRYSTPARYLLCMPMTHAAGSSSFTILALGGEVRLLEKPEPRAILEAIQSAKITAMMLTPTPIYSILALPDAKKYDLSSLKTLSFGGAPMSIEKLKEAIELFGPILTHGYGQTEAASQLTSIHAEEYVEIVRNPDLRHRLASCGRPTPLTQISIMAEDGRILPRGERGEIVVRSGMVMRGYLDDVPATEEVSKYGWHHTGDVGYIDEDGYCYIVDRLRDLIITGGFNVFPIDIEQTLWSHPSVENCAVIGLPHEKWGEEVTAVVQLKDSSSSSEAELIEFCKEKLGSVKSPKCVFFVDALPRSEVGKVLKRELREMFKDRRST